MPLNRSDRGNLIEGDFCREFRLQAFSGTMSMTGDKGGACIPAHFADQSDDRWERGVQPAKSGSSHESLCPYQTFEAADGPIMIGAANDKRWPKFCAVAGLGSIVDDRTYRTNADRVQHRAETLHHVQSVIPTNTVAHWIAALTEVGIPCSPINCSTP